MHAVRRVAVAVVALALTGCQASGPSGDRPPSSAVGPGVALPQTPAALRDAVARLARDAAAAPAGDARAEERRAAACAELSALSAHVRDPEVQEQLLLSSYSDLRLTAAATTCPDSPESTVTSLQSVSRDLAGGNLPRG